MSSSSLSDPPASNPPDSNAFSPSGDTDEQIKADTEDLLNFFGVDNRFKYKDAVAQGGFGTAHRLEITDVVNGAVVRKDFIVKVSMQRPDALEAMEREKEVLRDLQGGMHLVKMLNIPDNPLEKHNFGDGYVILEWIENGTLHDFLYFTRRHGYTSLPNRVLWRFFLCLLRAACGMSWPINRNDGTEQVEVPRPNVPTSGYTHGDLHAGNVLLGEFDTDEHEITPILKFIDFGYSKPDPAPPDPDAGRSSRENLFQIGILMQRIIALRPRETLSPTTVAINFRGQDITTMANFILPPTPDAPRPYPWLDQWLETLVALCMATEPQQEPSLADVTAHVLHAVQTRDYAFYGNKREEHDDVIRQTLETLMYTAPPPQ